MADSPTFTVTPELEARFWAKVVKGCPSECWEWTGHRARNGYGRIGIERRARNACHAALEIDGRARPEGLHALHSCDNRGCVNPSHLRWGTAKENGRDKAERKRCHEHKGVAHPRARLTEKQVLEIREASGTLQSIADAYGITFSAVWSIKNRKLWKHLK